MTALQRGLIAIFICLTLLIFIPSVFVWFVPSPTLESPPKTPVPPTAEKLNDKTLAAYQQAVAAYISAVTAYNVRIQAVEKSDLLAAYKLVVTDTLVMYFGASLASFIAFAFVSGATQVLDNRNRMLNKKDPQEIKFFR